MILIRHEYTKEIIFEYKGANLRRADLKGADLEGVRLNWNSRQLLSQILLNHSRTKKQKEWALYIRSHIDKCWENLLSHNHHERNWGLRVLVKYIHNIDTEILPIAFIDCIKREKLL